MNKSQQIRVAVQELRLVRAAEMGPVYFHGETMRPFMGEGDLVEVEPVSWEAIRIGDVITYRFQDKFPTRRVIWIDRRAGTLILRGDSIPARPNYLVHREDVLGRAVARVRNGERLNRGSLEWRWASWRALASHGFAVIANRSRRLVRGGPARVAERRRVG